MPYISKTPQLVQRASTYDGYLGIEAARNGDGTCMCSTEDLVRRLRAPRADAGRAR